MSPVSGQLTYSDALRTPVSFVTGDFKIEWDPSTGGRLSIQHNHLPGKNQWASLPGRSFVTAAAGRENVFETRANYFITDRTLRLWNFQQVNQIVQEGEEVVISGQVEELPGKGGLNYRLSFQALSGRQLAFSLSIAGSEANRLFLTYASTPDEHFFGFGEQFSYFDMKGRRLPIWISEQGVGRGDQPITALANAAKKAGGDYWTTYTAAPHYITSQLRSLYLENTEYTVFDLRRLRRVEIMVWAREVKGCIFTGKTPAELIEAYTALVGRMRPLPDWILEGAVVGMQGGTAKVRQVWQKLREMGMPVTGFWLQDWCGQRKTSFGKQLWWNWELDDQRYPEWEQLIQDMKERGVRMLTYINPFLADVSKKPYVKRHLFNEAAKKGFFIQHEDGSPYQVMITDFAAALIDFTQPEARAWYKDVIIKQVLAVGASGYMADFGEALPYDCKLASGETGAQAHNRYPEIWQQFNRELVDELENGDQLVFFNRAGFTRSPRYTTMMWAGDQNVTWGRHDGIKSAIVGMLSGGVSGLAFNHSDIGGYTAYTSRFLKMHRSKELLLRWMELGAFSVVFRTHEGNQPDNNHQFYSDAESLQAFNRAARLYAAWAFYRKQLVKEASKTGLPVMRHPFLEYPADRVFWKMDYQQFMLGSELMVVPVLDPGANSVRSYLPAGLWVDAWSGKEYSGWVTVPAPMGQPPVFYKKDSQVGEQFRQNLAAAGLLDR